MRYSEIEVNGSGFGNATSAYTYRPVDNPLKENVLAVKDMETGEQVKVSLDEAITRIRDGLAAKNQGKVICDK